MIGVGLYVKNSPLAVEIYEKAFGLELGYHVKNADGTFFHSELSKNGEPVVSVVEAPEAACGYNPVELGYTFENAEELRHAFDVLREGGCVKMEICELPWSPCAAVVIDRFGVRWFLSVPQHRPPEDFEPEDCQTWNA